MKIHLSTPPQNPSRRMPRLTQWCLLFPCFAVLSSELQAQAPPTISNVPNQTINEDANTGALAITVGDPDTATTLLSMSGSSSDTTLVPNSNIVFAGSGSARTVTVTPIANSSGTATITIYVGDGVNVTSDTFQLTVNSVNDAPNFTLPASESQDAAWIARETNRNWQSITSSADGNKLAATVSGGKIYTSIDAGVTWVERDSNRNWSGIASSADGTKLVAGVYGGNIYTSTDSGVSWVARDSSRNWSSIASSADGSKLAAVVASGQIYTSSNSGLTWVARYSPQQWFSITSSADGSKLAAVVYAGFIFTSNDSGVTWTIRNSARNWAAITSSADGSKLAAAESGGRIYTSTDSGITWVARSSNRQWTTIASSADGNKLAATTFNGKIFTSADSGVTWQEKDSERLWLAITSSSQGDKLAATTYSGQIFTWAEIPFNLTIAGGTGGSTTPSFASNISLGPADESSQTISFTVTNNNNSLFTVQPAITPNGALSFTPGTTAGMATVSVTAVDNGGTVNGGINTSNTLKFTITITYTDPLAAWRTLYFENPANTGDGANTADPDFDGLENLVEYAFGLHPKSGSSLDTPAAVRSGGNLVFTYTEPPGIAGITYQAEWSPDLIEWYPITDTGTGDNHIFSVPIGTNPKMFMRHRITQP